MITHPEELMARRLIEKHQLTPKIDVRAVAEIYALVENLEFPVSVDGVSLYLKSPIRQPEILINSKQPSTRWRFTLAHELGHVIIPWHVGSIVDDTDLAGKKEQSQYRQWEAEANRFAAELLMPSGWASDLIGNPKNMATVIMRLVEEAEVSVDAAVLKVLKVAPAGYVVAKVKQGLVVWGSRTQNTRANVPKTGTSFSKNLISPRKSYSFHESSSGVYHWWCIAEAEQLPEKPIQSGKDILQEIIDDIGSWNELKLKQQINGIIAVANGQLRSNRSREAIYAACLHNVRNRDDSNLEIQEVIDHKRFFEYIAARVYDFRV